MSRNAPSRDAPCAASRSRTLARHGLAGVERSDQCRWPSLGGWPWLWLVCLALCTTLQARPADPGPPLWRGRTPPPKTRVVIVKDEQATHAFAPDTERVVQMFVPALTNLTRRGSVSAAWLTLLGTQDVVGVKVFSSPGPFAGTRPAVVEAVVRTLLAVPLSRSNIVVWDKREADLRAAGFFELARRHGIQVASSQESGYDGKQFYEKPFVGELIFGDRDFGKKAEGTEAVVGRRSYVSRLLTERLTKIVNVTPLLNHNRAGVCGHLFSVAMGAVDNTLRFESQPSRLAEAVPELYALEVLGDRVVLNVTDALICQYQGERESLLHYSAVLNELRLSRDPVALDLLSLRELRLQRTAAGMQTRGDFTSLYENACLLELGVCEDQEMRVELLR